jgi:hypothetical protein
VVGAARGVVDAAVLDALAQQRVRSLKENNLVRDKAGRGKAMRLGFGVGEAIEQPTGGGAVSL